MDATPPMNLHKAARDPWVWGQLALLLLVGIGAPMAGQVNFGPLDGLLGLQDPRGLRRAGLVIGVLGAGVIWWGVRSLGRSLTPGVEPVPQASPVREGAYALVRHPIYTGLILLLAGYAWSWSNWRLAVLAGLGSWRYFDAKAEAEERHLLARYPAYQEYRRAVPKFFPW